MKFSLLSSVSSVALSSVIGVAVPTAAEATLTCSIPGGFCTETVDLGSSKTNFNLTATLDRFNLGAGFNLTSILVADGGSLTSSGFIKNTGTTDATFSYSGGLKLNLAKGAGAPASFPALTTTTNVASTEFIGVAPGNSVTYTAGGPLVAASSLLKAGVNVSQYVGNGTFPVSVIGAAHSLQTINQGNAAASVTTFGDPFVSITYNFTSTAPVIPAPEPAALAVLGAGLTGLGILRRRRRA